MRTKKPCFIINTDNVNEKGSTHIIKTQFIGIDKVSTLTNKRSIDYHDKTIIAKAKPPRTTIYGFHAPILMKPNMNSTSFLICTCK